MISNKTVAATMPTLPRICLSLSVIAEQPSLPTPSKPCLLIASEPILDFCWNTTPKCSFVTESLDAGATTNIFNTTLTVIQLGTSLLGISNLAHSVLFNSSLAWSQDNVWTSTWHLHMPKPMLMAIRDSITAFFWNVTHEIFLFIQNTHVIPTETGDASLPSIPLQN
jgi:hypothetical protein